MSGEEQGEGERQKKLFPPVTSTVLGGPECKTGEHMADLHREGVITLKACALLQEY